MRRLAILFAGAAVAAAVIVWAGSGARPAYPEGYRHWTHVKSMVILPGHPLEDPFAGIHHIYANAEALEGYRSGTWPDGAVIVFDLLEAKAEEQAYVEGSRKLIGVMVRDAARYAATGGWGFEAFAGGDPGRRLVTDGGASCFGCHESARGHVFSSWRD